MFVVHHSVSSSHSLLKMNQDKVTVISELRAESGVYSSRRSESVTRTLSSRGGFDLKVDRSVD